MFQCYWDDSGTDPQPPIAIAACYISTATGWNDFVAAWDHVRANEGFDVFHMADFAASHDKSKKPFCDWDYVKRQRVYRRLAVAINDNKRVGLGIAIPKDFYDRQVRDTPDWLRWRFGKYHYTFAIRSFMGRIKAWREYYGITLPMQYVFDREDNPEARAEIELMWNGLEKREDWAKWYGIESDNGYSFENRADFKPLQAADILAWQMNSHMRNVIMKKKHDDKDCHPNFRILREDQEIDLGFFGEHQIRSLIEKEIAYRIKHGTTENRF